MAIQQILHECTESDGMRKNLRRDDRKLAVGNLRMTMLNKNVTDLILMQRIQCVMKMRHIIPLGSDIL